MPRDDDGFLARWSQRKVALARGDAAPAEPPPQLAPAERRPAAADAAPTTDAAPAVAGAPVVSAAAGVMAPARPVIATPSPTPGQTPADPAPQPPSEAPAPPTLDDLKALTPASDFRRFVAPDVDPAVRNAAMKTLFSDPRFNVMDGLDIYIDDYNKPAPLAPGALRKMTQAAFLNLFDTDPAPPPPAAAAPAANAAGASPPTADESPDEDPDLRLQPNDAAGPPGPEPGAGEDPGRER